MEATIHQHHPCIIIITITITITIINIISIISIISIIIMQLSSKAPGGQLINPSALS